MWGAGWDCFSSARPSASQPAAPSASTNGSRKISAATTQRARYATFGERFVEEFRRAGGSTAAWAPAAVEALKKADRRTFIAALNRVSSASAKTLAIAAHTAEPETLARRAVKQARADKAENDACLAMVAVMLSI